MSSLRGSDVFEKRQRLLCSQAMRGGGRLQALIRSRALHEAGSIQANATRAAAAAAAARRRGRLGVSHTVTVLFSGT